METQILKVFVEASTHYFRDVAGSEPIVHPAYLSSLAECPVDDFGAVIGISGRYRGFVYLTAPRSLMQELLARVGEKDQDDRLCADLAGELCNTLSGNAREWLGQGFMISVPFILKGRPNEVLLPKGVDCYVIPIEWSGHRAQLVVAIRQEDKA
jgi:chemotaxis protein CheX